MKTKFVMYDVSVAGVCNVLVREGKKPEKVYENFVDDYGDKRDTWLPYKDFIKLYGDAKL